MKMFQTVSNILHVKLYTQCSVACDLLDIPVGDILQSNWQLLLCNCKLTLKHSFVFKLIHFSFNFQIVRKNKTASRLPRGEIMVNYFHASIERSTFRQQSWHGTDPAYLAGDHPASCPH